MGKLQRSTRKLPPDPSVAGRGHGHDDALGGAGGRRGPSGTAVTAGGVPVAGAASGRIDNGGPPRSNWDPQQTA